MVTTEQLSTLKGKLEAEKKFLKEELAKLGKQNPDNPADWIATKPDDEEFGADKTDNADIIEEMHENNASLFELEGRLNNVTRALEKMEGDTYGICEVSGHEIEIERLMANPAARTCMEHMSEESGLR